MIHCVDQSWHHIMEKHRVKAQWKYVGVSTKIRIITLHYYAKLKMRPIVTNVPWSVCVSLLVTSVSLTKSAETIKVHLEYGLGWDQGTTY